MSYVLVWEFEVRPELQAEFERHYGRDGSWARLFAASAGHVETVLLKDAATAGRYLTVDRWRDEAAYRAFRGDHAREYEQLDLDCERLTAGERPLGAFSECDA